MLALKKRPGQGLGEPHSLRETGGNGREGHGEGAREGARERRGGRAGGRVTETLLQKTEWRCEWRGRTAAAVMEKQEDMDDRKVGVSPFSGSANENGYGVFLHWGKQVIPTKIQLLGPQVFKGEKAYK